MTPFERKVVHDTVGGRRARSESEGVEPNRQVVVFPGLNPESTPWPGRQDDPLDIFPTGHLDLARRYAELLRGPAIRQGLVGPRERDQVWDPHVYQCALLALALPAQLAGRPWPSVPGPMGLEGAGGLGGRCFQGVVRCGDRVHGRRPGCGGPGGVDGSRAESETGGPRRVGRTPECPDVRRAERSLA